MTYKDYYQSGPGQMFKNKQLELDLIVWPQSMTSVALLYPPIRQSVPLSEDIQAAHNLVYWFERNDPLWDAVQAGFGWTDLDINRILTRAS